MSTPTSNPDDLMSLMDPYSSLLSTLSYFEIDGSILDQHDQSTNELVCTSKIMDLKEGDMINGTGDQENGTRNPRSIKQMSSRKKTSKGDRHSKISTAHGLRDRRVRLSLDVARQFFQLQDTLSYDKPSKTIKWLLQQAESAIEELKESKESPRNGAKSTAPSTSEGEVVESTIDEEFAHAITNYTACKQIRKSALHPAVTKELRKKARDRARERTLKKNQVRLLSNQERYLEEAFDLHQCHERAEGQLELGEDSGSQCQNQQIQYERNSFGAAENFKGIFLAPGANWSPLVSLTYDQEYETCQINPIPEFQFHGAPTLECHGHPHVSQYYWTS